MIEPIDINVFYEDAHLDHVRQRIYSTKRRGGEKYATVLIASCQNKTWWYKDYIGVTCFVKLIFSRYIGGEILSDTYVVNLTNSKILIGRSIDPKDIIIL